MYNALVRWSAAYNGARFRVRGNKFAMHVAQRSHKHGDLLQYLYMYIFKTHVKFSI